jgi:cephalosporin hydroxylase
MTDRAVIDRFHDLLYGAALETWANTYWLGVATEKLPLDLWVYQEMIAELRPDLIIETGTRFGGSALFMASICDLIGKGRVITIDLQDLARNETVRPAHPRIEYITASSTAPEALEAVKDRSKAAENVIVVLDSDHSMTHVVDELRLYSPFVTPGSYVVVEDTNVNGHPVDPGHGAGPMEAVELFLRENDEFVPDASREKFLVTFHPRGYLKRVGRDSAEARLLTAERDRREARDEADEARERLALREAELEQLLAETQAQLAARTNDALSYKAKLDAVLGSTSWRVTAPLRRSGGH